MRVNLNFGASARILGACALTSASGFAFLPASAQIVTDSVLSRAKVSGTETCVHLTIEFNTPIQYQSHFPEDQGRQLRISVLPVVSSGTGLRGRQEEGLRVPRSDLINVQNISYIADDPSGPKLTIDFTEEQIWHVSQGPDFTSIEIDLSKTPSGCSAAGGNTFETAQSILSVAQTVPDQFDINGAYSINLDSFSESEPVPQVSDNPVFDKYTAYRIADSETGKTWIRLRVGLFSSRHDAEQALAQLVGDYPTAWISRIDSNERETVYRSWLAAREIRGEVQVSTETDAGSASMLDQARASLQAGDTDAAISLTQSILARPESRETPEAQELLGIARERAGQLAHAKAEYEIYLERYPDGEGANRVRQRLAVLLSGGEAPPDSFAARGQGSARRSDVRTSLNGSLSALYQRDQSALRFEDTPQVGSGEVNPDPIEENRLNLNEVIYAGDVTASIGNDRVEGLFRFSGVHRDDLRAENPVDQTSISSLYVEVSDQQLGTTIRLGRQTRNTGGVFGRFDGGLVSVEPTEWLRLNAVAGAPVQRSRDLFVESDRTFFGGSVDLNLFDEKLESTVYYLDQTWGDLVDRRATGVEFRYFDAKTSAFGVFDYDLHYGEMNLALLSGTRRFEDKSSINFALDYRRSPLLTTFNSVIGQGVEDPNDLLTSYTEEEIYDLADDRTSESRSAIVSYSRPVSENVQLNVDFTATDISATDASGGVEAFPATGPDFYYSGQLIGSNFFKRGSVAVAGIRYADLEQTEQYTLLLNARYPISQKVRMSPKFRYDDRIRRDGSGEDKSARGSVRFTYDQNRTFHWETELGGEWADGTDQFGTSRENEFFFNFGIRVDF